MAKTHTELATPLATMPDEGGDHRSIAKQCLENIEQNWFTFSRVMFRIYRQEEYKDWGFSNFKDYVESELAFKYKSAMWRVQIGEAIEQFGVTADEVADMGWTKFGFLTPGIHKDMKRKDFMEMVRRAKDMTAREVKDFVESLHTETEVITKRATMTFLFTNESITLVREALTEGKSLANSESDAVALEYIMTEWLMNHNPKKATEIQAQLHAPPPKVEKPRKERSDVKKKAAKKEAEPAAAPKAKAKSAKKATAKTKK